MGYKNAEENCIDRNSIDRNFSMRELLYIYTYMYINKSMTVLLVDLANWPHSLNRHAVPREF